MHFRNGLAKVVANGVFGPKHDAGVRPKHRPRHAHALATSRPPRRHQVGQSLRICDLRVDDVSLLAPTTMDAGVVGPKPATRRCFDQVDRGRQPRYVG